MVVHLILEKHPFLTVESAQRTPARDNAHLTVKLLVIGIVSAIRVSKPEVFMHLVVKIFST